MGDGLTIFSTCRPFEHEFVEIQCNALASWVALDPRPEVILFGNEANDAARLWHCCLVSNVKRNRFGTPVVSDMWERAIQLASHETLCYVNADIVLLPDFAHALDVVNGEFGTFLMVGSRWDLISPLPDVCSLDANALTQWAFENGHRHKGGGSDYFAWRGNVWDNIPPFAIGRWCWDTWLMWEADRRGIPVVNATQHVLAIHQPHEREYRHGVEENENRALASEKTGSGAVSASKWVLTKEGEVVER
jgi:hypothetical protein